MSRSRWAAIAVAAAALAFSTLGVGLGVPTCRSLAACLELRLAPALTNGYRKHDVPPPLPVKPESAVGVRARWSPSVPSPRDSTHVGHETNIGRVHFHAQSV